MRRAALPLGIAGLVLTWLAGPRGLTLRYALFHDDGAVETRTTLAPEGLDFRLAPLRLAAYDARIYEVSWTGWLYVPRPGRYTFAVLPSAGPVLRVDHEIVLDATTQKTVQLDSGLHACHFQYHTLESSANSEAFSVWWRTDTGPGLRLVPRKFVFDDPAPGWAYLAWVRGGRGLLLLMALAAAALGGGAWLSSAASIRWTAWLERPQIARQALPLTLLGVAAAVRGWLLWRSKGMIESDEAAFGRLAVDILNGVNVPWAFHYGQHYQGVLEGYLLAALFVLLGVGPVVCKILPFLWSLVLVGLIYHIGRRLGGTVYGMLASLYLAFPPLFLCFMSLKVWFGYLVATIAGALLLWLALEWVQQRTGRRMLWNAPVPLCPPGRTYPQDMAAWGVAGLLAGMATWTYFLALPGVVAAALWVAMLHPAVLRRAELFWLAVVWFLVGLAPALAYNLVHNWASVQQFSATSASLFVKATALPYLALVLLGHLAPWPWPPGMAPDASLAERLALLLAPAQEAGVARFAPVWCGVLLLAGATVAFVWRTLAYLRQAAVTRGQTVHGLLAFVVASFLLVGAFLRSGSEPEAQYLLPLYPLLAFLFADAVLALGRRWPSLGLLVVLIVLGNHAAGLWRSDPMLLFQARHHVASGQMQPLSQIKIMASLREAGLTHGIADYWIGDRLSLESAGTCRFACWWYRRYAGWPDPARHPLWEILRAPRIGYLFHNNWRDTGASGGLEPFATIEQVRLFFGEGVADYAPRRLGPYTLFAQRGLHEQAERQTWKLAASEHPGQLDTTVDGDLVRGWSTAGPRRAGAWLAVDCGRPISLRRVVFLHGRERAAMTGPSRIQTSDDGVTWKDMARGADHWAIPATVATFDMPIVARHWRIVAETDGEAPWEIREVVLVPVR